MAAKSKKTAVAVSDLAIAGSDVMETLPRLAAPAGFPALSLESLADLGRDNLAAVAKANITLSEGLQAIGQEILTYASSSLATASHAATALLGAKTLDEVIQLNSDLAKASLETLVARSAKISEMGVSLASETLAPLGGRVEAAFARLTKHAAA